MPTLAELHPSAIVDGLHFQCSSKVMAQHKLKKRESKHECPEKTEKPSHGPRGDTSPASATGSNAESKTSRLQVMFSLSRVGVHEESIDTLWSLLPFVYQEFANDNYVFQININILQVSLVEEMIAFSALDHVKELTCVSVLAACIDNITCQLLSNSYSQKSVEVASDISPDSVNKKLPGVTMERDSKKKQESIYGVEESEQCIETQKEDMVGNLHVGRVHFQLRRMKKNYNEAVSLTAIPEYKSKVLFTFDKHNFLAPQRSVCLSFEIDKLSEKFVRAIQYLKTLLMILKSFCTRPH